MDGIDEIVGEFLVESYENLDQLDRDLGALEQQADAAGARSAIEQISEVISRIDALQATVASAVEEQSATTAEMVRSVTEVSSGTQEISDNIQGVATAATQTTAGASQTTTTAEELSRTARELRQVVSAFRL